MIEQEKYYIDKEWGNLVELCSNNWNNSKDRLTMNKYMNPKVKIIYLLTILSFISCKTQTNRSNTQGIIKIDEMELPEITYDFPENKSNPFDVTSYDRYFINANGFTNLTDNLDDFSIDTLSEKIPMGYKTIIICQKICIVNDGKAIKTWDYEKLNDSKSEINGRYYLYSNKKRKTFVTDWKRDVESYSVLKNTKDASIYSYLWESYDEAEQYAKEISEKEDITVMVSLVINSISWH